MEAPPGFEPGMEVLQTSLTHESRPEITDFRPASVLFVGWRWTATDRLLTAFDHNRDHSMKPRALMVKFGFCASVRETQFLKGVGPD